MDIKLNVQGVLTDPKTETQVVLLRAEDGQEVLPIWVGTVEGGAIKIALDGILPTRPMTHDLLKSMIAHLGLRVQKVIITEIKNNTYYALIYLESGGSLLSIDSRPSDAIALALRTHVPIYTTDEVLKQKAGDSLDTWLDRLNPKDFGDKAV
jgi:bifunctional DNase/RNase